MPTVVVLLAERNLIACGWPSQLARVRLGVCAWLTYGGSVWLSGNAVSSHSSVIVSGPTHRTTWIENLLRG